MFPQIKFIKTESVFDYSRQDLLEVYKKCFLGLRLTQHDVVANTACEMGLMGRRMIWNGDLPNAIHYENNVDKIAELIRKEWENRSILDYKKTAQDVYDYLDVGEDWLDTGYYE
jgi:hypothetical protein